MGDVTGPISTLPGALHGVPKGEVCDFHPDRPATARIQGETDSFGCEMHDLCDECAKEMIAEMREPDIGTCDWCKAKDMTLSFTRDYEEGLSGRVYQVCSPCIDRRNAEDQAELDRYGDRYDD